MIYLCHNQLIDPDHNLNNAHYLAVKITPSLAEALLDQRERAQEFLNHEPSTYNAWRGNHVSLFYPGRLEVFDFESSDEGEEEVDALDADLDENTWVQRPDTFAVSEGCRRRLDAVTVRFSVDGQIRFFALDHYVPTEFSSERFPIDVLETIAKSQPVTV